MNGGDIAKAALDAVRGTGIGVLEDLAIALQNVSTELADTKEELKTAKAIIEKINRGAELTAERRARTLRQRRLIDQQMRGLVSATRSFITVLESSEG